MSIEKNLLTVFAQVSLSLSLFLSALETTVVATALVKISEAFKTYDKAGWIVVSYMLTYTGMYDYFLNSESPIGTLSVEFELANLCLDERWDGYK